jgi:hypothetical protein
MGRAVLPGLEVHEHGAGGVQVRGLHLPNVLRALPAESHLEIALPDAQPTHRLGREVAVLDQPGLVALDRPIDPCASTQESDGGLVHEDERRRPDETAHERVVRTDDRVLDDVAEKQQHDEVEGVQLGRGPFPEQPQEQEDEQVDDGRPEDLLADRNAGGHQAVDDGRAEHERHPLDGRCGPDGL